MLNITGSKYNQWRELNRHVSMDIRRLYCQNEATISTVVELISDHIFDSEFRYDWCPEDETNSYERTLGALIKSSSSGNDDGASSKGGDEKRAQAQRQQQRIKGKNVQGASCPQTPNDPEQLRWMKETMREAMDYYYMFGMCPFRVIMGPDTFPKIIIPDFSTGNFIAKINEDTGTADVGWIDYKDKYINKGELEPDKKVGVYVWPQFKPLIDEPNPFRSVISKLRREYNEFRMMMHNNLKADQFNSNPLILTVSTDKPRSLEDMSFDEVLGDAIAFDANNQETVDMEKTRLNDYSMYESSRMSSLKSMQDASMGKGTSNLKIFDDGTETFEFSTNPWYGNEYPLPYGRTTASYPMPRIRTDLINWKEQWKNRISEAMRVPMDMIGKGVSSNKSATEVETSNKMFRGAVAKARRDVTEFMEEAWAQGMGRIEERFIYEGFEAIFAERERSKVNNGEYSGSITGDDYYDVGGAGGGGGEGTTTKKKKKTNKKGDLEADAEAIVTKEQLSKNQLERYMKGQELGPITAAEKRRVVLESEQSNAIEAFYHDMMRRAQSANVTVNPSSMYKNVETLIKAKMSGKMFTPNENSEYNDIVERETRLKIKKSRAKNGDNDDGDGDNRKGKNNGGNGYSTSIMLFPSNKEIDEAILKNGSSYLQYDDDDTTQQRQQQQEEDDITSSRGYQWLKNVLSKRRRLTIFWMMPAVSDPADIVFAMNVGSISTQVAHAMIKSRMGLPIDTPSGEFKEITIAREIEAIKQKTVKMTQEYEMKKAKMIQDQKGQQQQQQPQGGKTNISNANTEKKSSEPSSSGNNNNNKQKKTQQKQLQKKNEAVSDKQQQTSSSSSSSSSTNSGTKRKSQKQKSTSQSTNKRRAV